MYGSLNRFIIQDAVKYVIFSDMIPFDYQNMIFLDLVQENAIHCSSFKPNFIIGLTRKKIPLDSDDEKDK